MKNFIQAIILLVRKLIKINMNLKELQNEVKRVRVIDSTHSPNSKTKALIGKDLEVRIINYDNKTLGVWNEDKSDLWNYNFSDVQFLTPLKLNDRYIAIGDVLENADGIYEVYDYTWLDGEYVIRVARNKDYNNCTYFYQSSLDSGNYKLQNSQEDEIQKAIKLLEDNGRLLDGKVLK